MQPLIRLSPLTLPVPGSRKPLPRLDWRQASIGDTDSLTLPPLRLSSEVPSHRRTGSEGFISNTSSAEIPSAYRLPRVMPFQADMGTPPRSSSTRPYLHNGPNSFSVSDQNLNDRIGVPRSFNPEPSTAVLQTPTRMPPLRPRVRVTQPGFSQPTHASRGRSSAEELAAQGYTSTENAGMPGNDQIS